MHIIKLDAIDSTNSYLKRMLQESIVEDFTVIVAKDQFQGRGQKGNIWQVKAGDNLTFSVFKQWEDLDVAQHFYLNIMVSLAVLKTLQNIKIPNVSIKWPNDILSGNKKIGGILIENTLRNQNIHHSIIGVGLNINQEDFANLPQASSCYKIMGQKYNLEQLLTQVLIQLQGQIQLLNSKSWGSLRSDYLDKLFKKDKPSTFKSADGSLFMGIILGVSEAGYLQVKLEDDSIAAFGFKEVSLMY